MLLVLGLFLLGTACQRKHAEPDSVAETPLPEEPYLIVLGTAQDAGIPQLGCRKPCCLPYQGVPDPDLNVVALGLVAPQQGQNFLFEATPDIRRQLAIMNGVLNESSFVLPTGIFLTHAHMGHYTGLMHLGREALNAKSVPVYAMPGMKAFFEQNGPWDQLLTLQNIELQELQHQQAVVLNTSLQVTPIQVPHRDEYSETVGYRINGPEKSALFIPDIDKWEQWEVDIVSLLGEVDYAFLDATFFDAEEINNRDIKEIPHPFVIESIALFETLPPEEKAKVHFIHMNHTNPLLDPESPASKEVTKNGFQVARTHQIFPL